jgi:hypothetical protein
MKVEKEVEMYGYLQSSYEQDLEVVKAKLAEQGITHYSTYKANHCVGVSYGRVSAYYIVRNGKVVDIQID